MSTCSIEQDENILKLFHKTPGTPIKQSQTTPRRSSRKRSLFQSNSPRKTLRESDSDDLGPMSPLSASSDDSYMSTGYSPCFSPNGKFSTPPKTLDQSIYSSRKIEVKSSLFPNLKIQTPKSHRTNESPRRSSRRAQRTLDETPVRSKKNTLNDMTTPQKSMKKNCKRALESDDSDTSQNTTPHRKGLFRQSSQMSEDKEVIIISPENFYGSPSKTQKQKVFNKYDLIADKHIKKRSLSLDSNVSNKSFVSGSGFGNKKKVSNTHAKHHGSKRGRQKGPFIGVWHGVKKPKKMKFKKEVKKPLVTPTFRAVMAQINNGKPTQVKPKRVIEEKPKRRVAHRKKKIDVSDDDIVDSFPFSLIKRKKLPSTATHPANEIEIQQAVVPDPNKKFLKHGMKRKATFTLNENLKLQFSEGVMKLQSPKKKRKLYSGKSEVIFDFDDDEKNNEVNDKIENILNILEDDSENRESTMQQVKRISEDQLVNILNSPQTKISLVPGTPSKVLTEISGNRLLANMSSLAINELKEAGEAGCGSNENSAKILTESSLEKTGNILSTARNILTNSDFAGENFVLSEEGVDNQKNLDKFYSLFYKKNWNPVVPSKESVGAKSSAKKKSVLVPDDQYLLDAGQNSIGIVTCKKCGVMYQAGDFADEATHKKFHDHLPELRFTGWANERVVGRYLDGRVIMIVSSDPKPWLHKVAQIMDIVDQELGYPERTLKLLNDKTVYLFVNDKAKQIVGCLVAEECRQAYKMLPPLAECDVDCCSRDPSPCKAGISRIWTALNFRRQGVAKRMIDCLRRTFIFGEILPMDLVAFSIPSPSGKLLAQNVTGKMDFLVYGFI